MDHDLHPISTIVRLKEAGGIYRAHPLMDQRIHALRTGGTQTDGCGHLSIFVFELMILFEFNAGDIPSSN